MNNDRPPSWRRKLLYEDTGAAPLLVGMIATLTGMYMWQGGWAALAAFGFFSAAFGAVRSIVAAIVGERR